MIASTVPHALRELAAARASSSASPALIRSASNSVVIAGIVIECTAVRSDIRAPAAASARADGGHHERRAAQALRRPLPR